MFLLIGAGIGLYVCVALAFFVLSAMELAETDRGDARSLSVAMIAAIFWPVTLTVMSALVAIAKTRHSSAKLP